MNFWWFTVNPKSKTMPTKEWLQNEFLPKKVCEQGPTLKPSSNANLKRAKKNDLILAYKSGSGIFGVARVIHGWNDKKESIWIKRELDTPNLTFREMKDNQTLLTSQPIHRNAQGTWFRLSPREYVEIRKLLIRYDSGFAKKIKRLENRLRIKIRPPNEPLKEKVYEKEKRTKLSESESELVDRIIKNPNLIENGLELVDREANLRGFRADLIFKDKFGDKLIVEAKSGVVTRDAIGQIMQYYGILSGQEAPNIRLMLIGNHVPMSLRHALEWHGIEWKEV